MDLSTIFCTFGMCSLLYAAGGYLNEYCKRLEDRNQMEIVQKILSVVGVALFIFSIPALVVFYPLNSLVLRRMEKFYRKDERKRGL